MDQLIGGNIISPAALNYQEAFELGKYEAVEMRTKPKDYYRREAEAEFNEKFKGQLKHIKQTVRRDQVPYQRGYAIGVQKCARMGLGVVHDMNVPQVPLKLDVEDNGVVDKMQWRLTRSENRTLSARNDYRRMHEQDKRVQYDPQRQNATWIKLVSFYTSASDTNSAKVDLSCAKLRAENYLKDYAAGRKDLTKQYDKTWSTGYQGLRSDLTKFHPELINNRMRQDAIMNAMNPTRYLKNPAYFKAKAIIEAKKNGGMSRMGMLRKIKKMLGLEKTVQPEHRISADLDEPVDGLPNVNTAHSERDQEDGFDL